jgi:LytS/YehU family sensor histidine kinase
VIAGHLMLWGSFALAHSVFISTVSAALSPEPIGSRRLFSQFVPDAVLYLAITAAFTIAETRRRQTEVAEGLRAEVAEARLDALRQQLNPHFLFNTLNHIVMQLRSRDVEPAERMLLSLSDLLRDVLRERAQLIPLRDEVRMVERYLEIERERFGDRLEAEVTFEPRVLDNLVPSLILQPLLENAMRHGVSDADGRCRVWLSARAHDNRLAIEVRDAGPGIRPQPATPLPGVGLTNTAERLRYLYGKDHSFTLRTLEEGGLLVSIDLPFRRP